MINRDELLGSLKGLLHIESIEENTKLIDLGIDSLDVVEYLLQLENQYNIEFKPEEMEGLNTVGDLLKVIESKIQ